MSFNTDEPPEAEDHGRDREVCEVVYEEVSYTELS